MNTSTSNKSILNVPPILIIIFFFMPWITISCGGQNLGSFTGLQLATGNVGVDQSNSGEDYDGDIKLFGVPIAGILALIAVNMGRKLQKPLYIVAGIVGLAAQALFYLDIQRQTADASTQGVRININYEIGWWLTVIALVAVILLGIQHNNSEPPLPASTDSPPPS